jgi:hypothetical protein
MGTFTSSRALHEPPGTRMQRHKISIRFELFLAPV